jgi:hypothetical protein
MERDPITNIIVVRFEDGTGPYRALTVLRDHISVAEADVVERLPLGQIRVMDDGNGVGTLGELMGALGGPLGMLLEANQDISSARSALAHLTRAIPPGSTVLLAAVAEFIEDAIDDAMHHIGGSVTRRPALDVLAELDAVDVAQRAAARQAEQTLHEQKLGGPRQRAQQHLVALTAHLRPPYSRHI